MRVLYINADRGIPLGGHKGASVHVRQTVRALHRGGIDVVVASGSQGVPSDFPCSVLAPKVAATESTRQGREVSAHLAQMRFETQAFDLIYERYSLWSTAGLKLAKRLRVPLFLEVNAPLVIEAQRFRTLRYPGLARRIERANFRGADTLLPVSSSIGRYIAGIRGHESGIELTPNSVDTEVFRPDESLRSETHGREIIFVGSLKKWHGCDQLLDAMALVVKQAADVRLTMVGDGPERAALEARTRELGLTTHVRFAGAVDHSEIPRWLAGASIGVAPYPRLEDFYFSPLKVGEYLAAGLATVTTALGDFERWVRHEKSILVAEPDRPDLLAQALIRLCNNATLRQSIGAAGRRVAVRQLSLDAATARLIGRMQRAIESHQSTLRRVS